MNAFLKPFILLFLSIGVAQTLRAQNCSSHEMLQRQLEENPSLQVDLDNLEAETQAFILSNKDLKKTNSTKIIPVVFHVIHSGGNENISVAQIRNQMEILNAEFQRMFADTVKTPAPFKALAGKIDVEFRLASKDPEGNCTQGITRTYHPFSICSANEEDVKALQYWPNNKYLNIWLVSSMHYSGQTGCNGGGYAQFPGNSANQKTDGINIRGDLIGSIGTATTNMGWGNFQGRYLIHELGHWFNLRHIWGDASCGNDLVSDTPPHQQSNSGCPNFPWRPNNTCGGDSNGEMFTNYMDYTTGTCLNMFSKQQALRAEAALNSSASGRNNLWTGANLAATGTEQAVVLNCPAVPELFPYVPKIICGTGSHSIRDASYGGTKTSRLWTVPGGQSSGLTDSLISVTYSEPGVYPVTLSNTNSSGTVSKIFHDRVVVLENSNPINSGVPYTEDFEGAGLPSGWVRINSGGDTTWQVTGTTSFNGLQSLRLRNFSNKIGDIDELITPRFDLSNLASATLKFRLAFVSRSNSNKDKMAIFISKDCGQTWTSVYSKMANNTSATNELKTSTNSASNFMALTQDQWREESINISSTFRTNNVRFRVTFTSSGGNNLYIDDFKLVGTEIVSKQPSIETPEIELIPNPGNSQIRLLGLEEPALFVLNDLRGKVIVQKNVFPGEVVSLVPLPAGLYVWTVETKKGKAAGKWLCE